MQRIIPVSQGILENIHFEKIGNSLWVFLWCIDKMDEEGVVKFGKPIKWQDFGFGNKSTINNYIKQLRKERYIETKRTPYGLIIYVLKAKKIFSRKFLDKKKTKIGSRIPKSGFQNPKIWTENPKNEASNIYNNINNNIETLRDSKNYLLNIPKEDMNVLLSICLASENQIRAKGEQLHDWCGANGKQKKNYYLFLRGALRRDYPKTSGFDEKLILSA